MPQTYKDLYSDYQNARAEIEQLRAALEEIANYPPGDGIFAYRKLRDKARQALIREFGGER